MMRDNDRIALWDKVSCHGTGSRCVTILHVRPYNSIEAVAAMGSKYLMGTLGEANSLGSEATFPFDRPAELREALRRREVACRFEDDMVINLAICE